MANTLKNISLNSFRSFLIFHGLKKIRISGGHEIWSSQKLKRPVIIQSHINPIPEFIIRNNLRNMGLTKNDLLNYLNGN
jgi:hypothetical protein